MPYSKKIVILMETEVISLCYLIKNFLLNGDELTRNWPSLSTRSLVLI